MKKLIGRFYFKKTQHNNLLGEYSNNFNETIESECSDILVKEGTGDFIGKYKSTIHDERYNLTIKYKELSGVEITNQFSLIWENKKGDPIFWGEGFQVDNLLIGDYRNFEYIN